MADPSADVPNMEARVTAFLKEAEDTLVRDYNLYRSYVRENLKGIRQRVYAAERGSIRVLVPDGSGGFYPSSRFDEENLAPLVKELADAAPADARMDYFGERAEQIAQIEEEMQKSGLYSL